MWTYFEVAEDCLYSRRSTQFIASEANGADRIALFVVIICSRSAARGPRSLCARLFCGRMQWCSND